MRKTTLAIATIAVLGAAALVPATASAKGFGNWGGFGHHGFFHGGFGVTVVDTNANSCWQFVKIAPRTYQKQWVCNN